jgi:hypothetical protein
MPYHLSPGLESWPISPLIAPLTVSIIKHTLVYVKHESQASSLNAFTVGQSDSRRIIDLSLQTRRAAPSSKALPLVPTEHTVRVGAENGGREIHNVFNSVVYLGIS